jgi:hypothetical protein
VRGILAGVQTPPSPKFDPFREGCFVGFCSWSVVGLSLARSGRGALAASSPFVYGKRHVLDAAYRRSKLGLIIGVFIFGLAGFTRAVNATMCLPMPSFLRLALRRRRL